MTWSESESRKVDFVGVEGNESKNEFSVLVFNSSGFGRMGLAHEIAVRLFREMLRVVRAGERMTDAGIADSLLSLRNPSVVFRVKLIERLTKHPTSSVPSD